MSPFVFERVGKSWNDLVVGHNNKQYSKGLNDIFKIICNLLKIPKIDHTIDLPTEHVPHSELELCHMAIVINFLLFINTP
jgi:hypothetical protein